MNATIIEAERVLPYAPDELCRMVGDVKAYPRFIPWLKSLHVHNETPLAEGGWQGVAEAAVGWRAFHVRFSTKVVCAPARGEVDVTLVKGPFKTLSNRWRFETDGQGGARVRFWISYEFKLGVLQAAASANRDLAAKRIMEAFEKEARRRLG